MKITTSVQEPEELVFGLPYLLKVPGVYIQLDRDGKPIDKFRIVVTEPNFAFVVNVSTSSISAPDYESYQYSDFIKDTSRLTITFN